jgi:hypothetical protein
LEPSPEEQAVIDEFGPRPTPVSGKWIVHVATITFLVVLLSANLAIVTTYFRSRTTFSRSILANIAFMVVGTLGYAFLDRYSRGALPRVASNRSNRFSDWTVSHPFTIASDGRRAKQHRRLFGVL